MDSNSYLELSLKLQMVPLSLYPVKSLILLMVQGYLRAKLWTPLTVPDSCPQVSCHLFSGCTHEHPVLSPHRLFFVRSTYFFTNQPKIQRPILSDLQIFTQITLKFQTQVLQVLNFNTNFVNLTKLVVICWFNWWQNISIWQRIISSRCTEIFVRLHPVVKSSFTHTCAHTSHVRHN